MSLQAAAMRRTGFFCNFSQLVSISSSTQAKQIRRDQALHREMRLCGNNLLGFDSIAAHRVQAPYWTRSVHPQEVCSRFSQQRDSRGALFANAQ